MKKFKQFAIVALVSVAVLAFVLALAVGASPLAQEAPTPTPDPTATAIAVPTPVKVIAFSGYSDCRFTAKGPGVLRYGFRDGVHGRLIRITGGETVIADVEIPAVEGNNWTYYNLPLDAGSWKFEIKAEHGWWFYKFMPPEGVPVTVESASQPTRDSGQELFRMSACRG